MNPHYLVTSSGIVSIPCLSIRTQSFTSELNNGG